MPRHADSQGITRVSLKAEEVRGKHEREPCLVLAGRNRQCRLVKLSEFRI